MNKDISILNQDGQLVVTSRQIAGDFDKRHADVLERIEELIKTEKSVMTMFIESSYKAGTGKPYKEYLITRDGFSLLVMGFTGSKALTWKLKYIEAFNKMEEHIKGQAINIPKLSKELQAILMLDEKTVEMDNRLSNLEERMTIETGAQKTLCDLVNKKIMAVLGGKDTPAYKELSKKAYSQCWKDYKRIVGVASYKDTAIKDFDFARKVIIDWKPNRELELMIRGCNAQIRM
ncbi:ORF6C domain-containing protein [Clostridium sp.]|uniref:ORF6C domain-containing protein n=1 Tax=Clostridium sp. TaxID=1506 RepID=UPI00290E8237|nr:ORF6C domain-containing protein [Clostridium sp.]MDU3526587.1 ORF6C domain-containing protein [Clostridium sp.]